MQTIAVIGATGEVGTGITRSAGARGFAVTAVARSTENLEALRQCSGETPVRIVTGSVADEESAARLAAKLGEVDTIVVCVSAPFVRKPLAEWSTDELVAFTTSQIGAHHAAARHLLPLVRSGGTYLGIGGGTADFILPDLAPVSIVQAAQRMLYLGLAKEARRRPVPSSVRILELLISAMVNGTSTRRISEPDWITDDEVGDFVCDLLQRDERGPVLKLTSPRAPERASESSTH